MNFSLLGGDPAFVFYITPKASYASLALSHTWMAFGAEPEADQYGVANAITRAAQSEANWEKSLGLERIGGKLITVPKEKFKGWDE